MATPMHWFSLPSTANLAELIWTLASFVAATATAVGLGFTLVNLRAADRAHRRACTLMPPEELYTGITQKDLRNERLTVVALVLLLLKLISYVGIGVLAMMTPPPVTPQVATLDLVATGALVVGVLLLAGAVGALAIGSALNRRDRHRLVNAITARLLVEMRTRRMRSRQGEQP